MSMEQDKKRLLQEESLEYLLRNRSPAEMVTVYLDDWPEKKTHSHGIYCALIPSHKAKPALLNSDWDLDDGGGQPGTVEYCENGTEHVEYLRFGREDGIDPLVD